MLSVCLPGTGGMLPLPGRYLACCLLEYQGKSVLIDCGEGTQMALRAAGCRISRIERILITHLHADHLAGLPGLLVTVGNTGRTEPLLLAGPPGLYQAASALMQIAPVPYPVQVAELAEGGGLEGWAGLRIRSLPLKHGIPCYGYRCEIERKPVLTRKRRNGWGFQRNITAGCMREKACGFPTAGRWSRRRCWKGSALRWRSAIVPIRCPSRTSPVLRKGPTCSSPRGCMAAEMRERQKNGRERCTAPFRTAPGWQPKQGLGSFG